MRSGPLVDDKGRWWGGEKGGRLGVGGLIECLVSFDEWGRRREMGRRSPLSSNYIEKVEKLTLFRYSGISLRHLILLKMADDIAACLWLYKWHLRWRQRPEETEVLPILSG